MCSIISIYLFILFVVYLNKSHEVAVSPPMLIAIVIRDEKLCINFLIAIVIRDEKLCINFTGNFEMLSQFSTTIK